MAAMVERRISTLNPDAPMFDPVAFREVEDFSPRWWELVRTSKWFRDFWLSANPEDEFGVEECSDAEEQFEELVMLSESVETIGSTGVASKLMNGVERDAKAFLKVLNLPESPKERGPKYAVSSPKNHDKPAKHVNPKFSPRRIRQIYQPR